jgi:hypothetical protein
MILLILPRLYRTNWRMNYSVESFFISLQNTITLSTQGHGIEESKIVGILELYKSNTHPAIIHT